ncbi:PAT1 domain containing protein [Pyrenophora tritici-repentis]|nr:PAT1 domain containing protein [Pyrenophora tritici-repentis]
MAGSQSNSGDTDADVQEQLLNAPSERNISKRSEAASLWAKFTAEHLMRHCPYTVTFDYINPSLWGVPAPEDADETHATTWVAKAIHDYHVGMEWDERLYFDYQWDFEGWTRELFQKVERTTLRSLKTVLRYRGVYTGKFRARVADSLFNLLGGENAPEWDPAEFKAEKFDERSEAYQRQQNAHLAAPMDRQLPQPQPPPQLQPQPQRPSQGEQQGDQQGEQYGVRQGVRSHSQYQELQRPLYVSNTLDGQQPRRQREQTTQPQHWHPQPQTQRPPTTAYREITPYPQQPIMGVPDRPPEPLHDPYKTLPKPLCLQTPHTPNPTQMTYMPQPNPPPYDDRDPATTTDSADQAVVATRIYAGSAVTQTRPSA